MDKTTLILGIIIGAVCMYFLLHLLWRLGYYLLYSILSVIRHSDHASDLHPKALANMESMVLPQVLREFPDFDPGKARQDVREFLLKNCGNRPGFQVHEVVLNDYRKQVKKRELVFEASVSWQRKKTVLGRMDVFMECSLPDPERVSAVSCPNCGGEIKSSDVYCSFCGSKLAEKPEPQWAVYKVREI